MEMCKMKRLTISLTPLQLAFLNREKDKRDVTKSQIIRACVQEMIDKSEVSDAS